MRTGKVDSFPDHMLEREKYEQFVELHNQGKKGLFILFFEDGVICYNISQRLDKLARGEYSQLIFVQKLLPKSTMKERGKVWKPVAFLKREPGFSDQVYFNTL